MGILKKGLEIIIIIPYIFFLNKTTRCRIYLIEFKCFDYLFPVYIVVSMQVEKPELYIDGIMEIVNHQGDNILY